MKPYHIPFAKKHLEGSSVLVCPVIGFPHGNSTTEVKVFEATRAAEEGGQEIDMVVNIGKVLSGEWQYVSDEISKVNKAVVENGAILKVIFENDCERSLPTKRLTESDFQRSLGARNHQTVLHLQ